MLRVLVQDKFNKDKVWQISKLSHGIYLHQLICGRKYGRGCRTSKKWLIETGIAYMKPISVTIKKGR